MSASTTDQASAKVARHGTPVVITSTGTSSQAGVATFRTGSISGR